MIYLFVILFNILDTGLHFAYSTGLDSQRHQILQCLPYVNDQIQYCVMPVADYAKTLNQEVVFAMLKFYSLKKTKKLY